MLVVAPVDITAVAKLSVVVAVLTANFSTVPKVDVFTPSLPIVASFVTVNAVPVALSVVAPCNAIEAPALPIVVVAEPVVFIFVRPVIVFVELLLPIPIAVVLVVPIFTEPAPELFKVSVPVPFDCKVIPVLTVLVLITGVAPLNVNADEVSVFVLNVPADILPLLATVNPVELIKLVYVPFSEIALVAVPFEFVMFNRLVVVPLTPFLLNNNPSVCVPLVLVAVMLATFDAVADEPVAVKADAAPVWTIATAVAAVPVFVPFTVSPTTPDVAGVTVLAAEVVGTCCK